MNGTMDTQSLYSTNGVYISALNMDKSFKNKGNPSDYFKFIISPIEGKICYVKIREGCYQIYGEGWIVTGDCVKIEKEVAELVAELAYATNMPK